MKNIITKSFVLGLFLIFSFALVSSASDNSNKPEDMPMAEGMQGEPQLMAQGNMEMGAGLGMQERIRTGSFSINGKEIQVRAEAGERIRLQSGNFSAECMMGCNLSQENVDGTQRLYAKMSNGKNAEIKIMPETASERALERLQLRNCNSENNCSIELKEVGNGNQTRMAYEVKTQKNAKFLGLFSTRMNVDAEVDAETGEVISSNKPWWAFLASEEDEIEAE